MEGKVRVKFEFYGRNFITEGLAVHGWNRGKA
jgi:hypothetical protein